MNSPTPPSPDESLIDALETVLLRCRAGQTLTESLKDMPLLYLNTARAREWSALREGILEGRIPAIPSLNSWIQQLRSQSRLRKLVALRTRNPRTQSRALGILTILFFVASRWWFPQELQASWTLLFVSGCWAGVGYVWLRWELNRFESRLWFAEWVGFLSRVAGGLAWGRTFGSSWIEEESSLSSARWPTQVRRQTQQFAMALRSYEAMDLTLKPASKFCAESKRALEQIKLLHNLHFESTPLREAMDSFVLHGLESFETKLSDEAERLSLRALLPLFCCFAPAMLLLIFGPLLSLLGGV